MLKLQAIYRRKYGAQSADETFTDGTNMVQTKDWFDRLSLLDPAAVLDGEDAIVTLLVHAADAEDFEPSVVRTGGGPRLECTATPMPTADFEDETVVLAYSILVPLEDYFDALPVGDDETHEVTVTLAVSDVTTRSSNWIPRKCDTRAGLAHELRALARVLNAGASVVSPEPANVTFDLKILRPFLVTTKFHAQADGSTRLEVVVKNCHAARHLAVADFELAVGGGFSASPPATAPLPLEMAPQDKVRLEFVVRAADGAAHAARERPPGCHDDDDGEAWVNSLLHLWINWHDGDGAPLRIVPSKHAIRWRVPRAPPAAVAPAGPLLSVIRFDVQAEVASRTAAVVDAAEALADLRIALAAPHHPRQFKNAGRAAAARAPAEKAFSDVGGLVSIEVGAPKLPTRV
ncbi:hypothetical protein M885DRAFT_504585 [Pelagophyceae sp. CCMP2097]|nr:hypothetical protein M885DRAFT_504585 [Pelagophyceae sp. CCMP2097]